VGHFTSTRPLTEFLARDEEKRLPPDRRKPMNESFDRGVPGEPSLSATPGVVLDSWTFSPYSLVTCDDRSVKAIAEYLERAHHFERIAQAENNPRLRAKLVRQANAYHTLATKPAEYLALSRSKGKKNSK